MFMMYEAFQLTLNQVSGSIGQDAMSMELLCIIDVSHRIDKNISKIASIAISFFFSLNDKRQQSILNTRSLQYFLFSNSFDLEQIYEMTNCCQNIFTKNKRAYAVSLAFSVVECVLPTKGKHACSRSSSANC